MKKISTDLVAMPGFLREAIPETSAQEQDPMADTTKLNLALWDQLRPVDRAFTKPITGKAYKGDSPNPTYMIQKITEALGPIGQDWGFEVMDEQVLDGRPIPVTTEAEDHYGPPTESGGSPVLLKRVSRKTVIFEQYHQVRIRFWFKDAKGIKSGTYDAFGGTPMRIFTRDGKWMMDEDAAKKSLTDAYTKGLSWLGVAADLFLGLFDDKYQAPLSGTPEEPRQITDQSAAAPQDRSPPAKEPSQAPQQPPAQPAQRQTTQPSGW